MQAADEKHEINECDWIWLNPASMYNYKYLEIPILIIFEVL